jgi:hypothetical protein
VLNCTPHAIVDNRVEEVDVVLVGDARDVVAPLDTALEAGAAAAEDAAAVLRAAFGDRAAGAAADHAQDAAADVGYDASGYTAPLDADRDVDQGTAAGRGMST